MASTGEVACFGENCRRCYLKAIFATGIKINKKGFVELGGSINKERFLESYGD
jgi:hypothetical protein